MASQEELLTNEQLAKEYLEKGYQSHNWNISIVGIGYALLTIAEALQKEPEPEIKVKPRLASEGFEISGACQINDHKFCSHAWCECNCHDPGKDHH